jgi:hypothetical protein
MRNTKTKRSVTKATGRSPRRAAADADPHDKVLKRLQPEERARVLSSLLERQPELVGKARQIARAVVKDVDLEGVAEEVEWVLRLRFREGGNIDMRRHHPGPVPMSRRRLRPRFGLGTRLSGGDRQGSGGDPGAREFTEASSCMVRARCARRAGSGMGRNDPPRVRAAKRAVNVMAARRG